MANWLSEILVLLLIALLLAPLFKKSGLFGGTITIGCEGDPAACRSFIQQVLEVCNKHHAQIVHELDGSLKISKASQPLIEELGKLSNPDSIEVSIKVR